MLKLSGLRTRPERTGHATPKRAACEKQEKCEARVCQLPEKYGAMGELLGEAVRVTVHPAAKLDLFAG